MPRRRGHLVICLLATIAVGVVSRKAVSPLPYWLKECGDVLWAIAAYWVVALVRPAWRWPALASAALALAWASELSQLSHAPWLESSRKMPLLKMLLGAGFSWVDMAMYVIGVVAAAAIDLACRPHHGDVR